MASVAKPAASAAPDPADDPPGEVLEVPRIVGRAPGAGRGAEEEVEFRHRRLERHNGARRLERVDDGCVFRRPRRVFEDERALGDAPARPGEFVLDGDRDPFERPCVAAPIAILGVPGILVRLIEMLVGDAVNLRIERFNALDLRFQQIDRRCFPGPEHGHEIVDRRIGERIVGIRPRGRRNERRGNERCPRAFDERSSIDHVRLPSMYACLRRTSEPEACGGDGHETSRGGISECVIAVPDA